jgi:GNAT superfamily N-acetyltransferase
MEIIEYGPDRVDIVFDIEKRATERYDEIVPGFMGELMTLDGMKAIFAEGVRFFCAEIDGVPAGTIGYIVIDGIAFIRGLFVSPDFQRQGVGAELIAFHESLARSEDASQQMLLALAEAYWARDFYAKYGFEEIVEGKDEIIAEYWKPIPDSMRSRFPDVPYALLVKPLWPAP